MKKISDYFGKNATDILSKRLFLLDMDGTIYNENTLFDGVLEFLTCIDDNGGKYVFITNNSSKSVDEYIQKLKLLGINSDRDNFFTSIQASALLLKREYPNAKVYCQGTKAMITELKGQGIEVTEDVTDDAEVILVGFDTELTSDKLRKTCEMLVKSIPFYATNPDLACPTKFGFIPDCGSICSMLKNASGRAPIYIGKPEPTMINIVMRKFGVGKEETVVIGDRLYTDIAAGNNAGITSVCVLSGEAKECDIIKGNIKPTYTFRNIADMRIHTR